IRVVLALLKNFLLIKKVNFIWLKWNKCIMNYIKYPYLHKIQVIKTVTKIFNMCKFVNLQSF
ncbi:hypothetical protein GLOIN_2v1700310, partial [Rhizophagus irregularis DAOM 181602=DAOM 197198]